MDVKFPEILNQVVLPVLIPYLITFYLTPIIFRIALIKDITAHENGRTSHHGNVPLMGGLAVFAGFFIASLLLVDQQELSSLKELLAGTLIILMMGMKDDLSGVPAWNKIAGQLLAAGILIFVGDVRFTNLHGFLGIGEIGYGTSVVITLITIVGLTNCYNLIDGVDALAAGLGSISLTALAAWFGINGNQGLMMVSIILTASLMAFIPFNLRNHKRKIFMGDTGSLPLGFVMAYLIIEFNQLNIGVTAPWDLVAAPAISIGIAFIPVFDTLRVMLLRLIKQKSPFSADKNHMHHKFLALGLSHGQTSLLLVLLNVGFILLAFFSQNLGTTVLLGVLLLTGAIVFALPALVFKSNRKRLKGGEMPGEY